MKDKYPVNNLEDAIKYYHAMNMKEIKAKVKQYKLYRNDAVRDMKAANKIKASIQKALESMPDVEKQLYAEDIAKINATLNPPIFI